MIFHTFKLEERIEIEFLGQGPDSAELRDYILQESGKLRYTETATKTIPIIFTDGKGMFVLEENIPAMLSSSIEDYQSGALMRGFKLTCTWGENECEYAFIFRCDA